MSLELNKGLWVCSFALYLAQSRGFQTDCSTGHLRDYNNASLFGSVRNQGIVMEPFCWVYLDRVNIKTKA